MRKIIFFDFDGTLVDTFNLAFRAYNELAPKYGARLIKEEERDIVRTKSARELLKLSGLPLYNYPVFLLLVKNSSKIMLKKHGFFLVCDKYWKI